MLSAEFDEGIVDSAVVFHDTLNPSLWTANRLKPLVRLGLLKIAKDFVDFIGVDKIDITDITISGSNAAFTYTPRSDLDLHLIVRIPESNKQLYKELFDAKKNQYNTLYKLTVKDVDVELYVQDATDTHHSAGIYSVKHDRWVSEPKRIKVRISDQDVQEKVNNYIGKIKNALDSQDLGFIGQVQEAIKKLRQSGLDREGEFSIENIAYKVLRAKGWLERLRQHKYTVQSEILSVENIK